MCLLTTLDLPFLRTQAKAAYFRANPRFELSAIGEATYERVFMTRILPRLPTGDRVFVAGETHISLDQGPDCGEGKCLLTTRSSHRHYAKIPYNNRTDLRYYSIHRPDLTDAESTKLYKPVEYGFVAHGRDFANYFCRSAADWPTTA